MSDIGSGIGSYLRQDSDYDTIIVRENVDTNKKLALYSEDGTKTEISTSTSISSDNKMCFVNVADVMYCMNGSDPFGKLSGTTYTVPSNVPTNFAPAF